MNDDHDFCCGATAQLESQREARCAVCGQPGKPVARITLKHTVRPEFLELVTKPGFRFCRSPHCDVVYFHPDGAMLRKGDVRLRVGLKETEDPVPLCYCFGFTEAMVREEIRATGSCTIPRRITAEVKAAHCACEIRNPQGSCCLGNVTAAMRKAMRLMAARQGP
ncbi:MAG: copper chaperone Copz family protein [Verrucomicrobia bacterium]|nr:copper chaperone Copz family protein [Verrucomicrobiota bacterium]